MDLAALQTALADRYLAQDREVGVPFLVSVLQEEVGELARAVRRGEARQAGAEAVDVLFMALSICNVLGHQVEPALRGKFLDRPLEEVTATWEDVPSERRRRADAERPGG